MFKFSILLVVASSVFLGGCYSTEPNAIASPSATLGNLVLAEPAAPSYRAQRALAQFNQIVLNGKLSDDERAQLLFQRGLVHDSLGLGALAHNDYLQAIRLQPLMSEAYNSLGIHYTTLGNFDEAYDALDATLDMDPSYAFAYFNRGLTAYYHERYELSYQDFSTYLELDNLDPLRSLWRYFAAVKYDSQSAKIELQTALADLPESNWSRRIVSFFLGQLSQNELLDSVVNGIENQQQLNERLCELYFYLGKYHLQQGNSSIANNFFKLSLSTNIYEFVEYRFARIELNKLREQEAL